VTNPNTPGKLRIILDATAEHEGISLDKNVVCVLLQFRQGHVGIATGVKAMFHQVRVRKQDQDALRFLWWTDDYNKPPMFTLCFGIAYPMLLEHCAGNFHLLQFNIGNH